MKNIIFLDIDGVLNCEIFYLENQNKKISKKNEYKFQLCEKRIAWLNNLCKETDSAVVISSTWRLGRTVKELQKILKNSGAKFKIIDSTPYTGYERGTEISKWLQDNCQKYFGVDYFDFFRYAIIDDDADVLLTQAPHFFKTDPYSGLTPDICRQIKKFLIHKTF